jgi:hypothetical protein
MTNKFHHLRTANILDGSKRCPWPGCLCEIPLPMFMCREHWQMLPKPLRDMVWDAYEVGQELDARMVSDEYRDAEKAARNWVNSYLAAEGATPPPGQVGSGPGYRRPR